MDTTHHRWHAPRPAVLAGITAILALLLAVGLAVPLVESRSAIKKVNLSTLRWVFYNEDLNRLSTADPGLMARILASPAAYSLIGAGAGSVRPEAIPTEKFFSYADFASALQSGTILPNAKAVLYDPENWAATPVNEQQDPMRYMRLFGETALGHGFPAILAPGRDLTNVSGGTCTKSAGETLTQAYLRCGLASAAAYVPIFIIQGAPVETDLGQFKQLVQQAAAQARAANPNVIVLVTLSTDPGGVLVSSAVITQAARTALPYVQGLLPNSTAATDGTMIAALRKLANGS